MCTEIMLVLPVEGPQLISLCMYVEGYGCTVVHASFAHAMLTNEIPRRNITDDGKMLHWREERKPPGDKVKSKRVFPWHNTAVAVGQIGEGAQSPPFLPPLEKHICTYANNHQSSDFQAKHKRGDLYFKCVQGRLMHGWKLRNCLANFHLPLISKWRYIYWQVQKLLFSNYTMNTACASNTCKILHLSICKM